MLAYLAKRQQVSLPYLPVCGAAKCNLFHRLVQEAMEKEEALGKMNTFENMADAWNTNHLSVKENIFQKMPFILSVTSKIGKRIRSETMLKLCQVLNDYMMHLIMHLVLTAM